MSVWYAASALYAAESHLNQLEANTGPPQTSPCETLLSYYVEAHPYPKSLLLGDITSTAYREWAKFVAGLGGAIGSGVPAHRRLSDTVLTIKVITAPSRKN